MAVAKAKKKKDRKLELLKSWTQTKKVTDAIITAGLQNPLELKKGVLRELVSLLSHGSKVVAIMATLESQGVQGLYVQKRRMELIKMYDGIAKIADTLTAEALLSPLDVNASMLNQLGTVARRSLEMITLLESIEAEAEDANVRDQHQGATPEEMAMLESFKEIEKDLVDMEAFKTSSDPFAGERKVD